MVWSEDKEKIALATEMMLSVSQLCDDTTILKMYVSGLSEDNRMVAILHINLLTEGKTSSLLPEDWDPQEYFLRTLME